ncbi:MAG: hypothetical protein IAG10_03045 [Planctomycetaceae bacterium]|nr:hypothetical protein [Planctomycetaceae bacterium]
MVDDESKSPHRKRWIIGVVLSVLYVLSVGPARFALDWLMNHSSSGRSQFMLNFCSIVYAPLIWTAEGMPWVYEWLEWYVELFV